MGIKPLLRWTINNVSKLGFEVLEHSIKEIKKIYGNEFDYLICHNGLKKEQYDAVSCLGVDCYAQSQNDLFCKVSDEYEPMWKFYPPRLRHNAHEIFIDNDVIIFNRLRELDHFLNVSDHLLITEAMGRHLGDYEEHVQEGVKLNSGVVGLYPGFDFQEAINKALSFFNPWEVKYRFANEQGMMNFIFQNHPYYLIPIRTLAVLAWHYDEKIIPPFCRGFHFTGINRAKKYPLWDYYLSKKVKFL